MSDILNIKQEEVINNTDGIYVVDAGAGTGKTHTITRRYLKILEKPGIKPENILLLTFTNNAADNMKEKIMNRLIEKNPEINALDAKISTFHSFCKKVLSGGAEGAPKYLGIAERLNPNFNLSENDLLEKMFFRRVYGTFKKKYTVYDKEYKIIGNRILELFSLIRKLLSKGIFPKKTGWFLEGEKFLNGDKRIFLNNARIMNAQEEGKNGPKQSRVLTNINSKIKNKFYFNMPVDLKINKQVKPSLLEDAFLDDRQTWISFVHDLYHFYISESLKENKLTFDFLTMFAFLELYHNKESRKINSFRYLMIDEFQDTNEMQFMLSLLLMKEGNLCVVGDWKQGIYGFRNATIENIIQFDDKIVSYKEMLNHDEIRVKFNTNTVHKEFELNYRSSQNILDFSEKALLVKGAQKEILDEDDIRSKITRLKANYDLNDLSIIDFFETQDKENEAKLVLLKIQEIVNNELYKIKEFNEDGNEVLRKVKYSDIAVLTRTRSFGIKLQKTAINFSIPVNYEGGIELFKTEEALMLLAVLRILACKYDEKGWITILNYLNYSLGDKKYALENRKYPQEILNLRSSLFKYKKNITFLISNIFEFFKIDTAYSNSLLKILGNLFTNYLMSHNNLIYFIEENIQAGTTFTIDINSGKDAVIVETIHGAKGLEYPVVFISNCNMKHFPSSRADSDILSYDELYGLRCSKLYEEKNGFYALFDNFYTDLLKSVKMSDYDEERRLLYVAMTRAKQYLFFTASSPSAFFNELKNNNSKYISEIELCPAKQSNPDELSVIKIPSYNKKSNIYSVHDLINYKAAEHGRGKEFGNKIHNLAELLALGRKVKVKSEEVNRISNFLAQINSNELKTEIECALPVGNNLIRGIIDLLIVYDDKIVIVDYKTDESKLNHEEYIKQISVYYHAAKEFYKKPVECKIFYVCQNDMMNVMPLTLNEIEKLILCLT